MTLTEPTWRDEHWLKFTKTPQPYYGPVVGCHCGFESYLDESCGWGDDVLAHVVEAARRAR